MTPNDYEKGKEMGEVIGEVKTLNLLLSDYVKEQREWNRGMEKRVSIIEQWIQTTTGKVIVLTTVFGIVGSLAYIGINWVISHFKF